ncbi:MAG: hypothetical protein V1661_02755 [bacterium]
MLPIAQIIHLSWTIYISKFKKYLPLAAILFVSSAASSLLDYYLSEILLVSKIPQIIYSVAISAAFYFLNLGATIFLIFYTDRFIDNKKADFKLSDLWPVYLPALGVSLLAGIITIGGFLMIVIPGILFTTWYAFVIYGAVLEKRRGWDAFQKSHDLSKGRFWPIFGRVIVPNLFWGIIAYLVLAGIFNLLGMFLNQSLTDSVNPPIAVLSLMISALAASFFAPLSIITLTITYREAKR